MKRLLLAPLLLTLLFGCSGQRNSIIKDKWITGKELDSNISLNIEWKYIDCVNNICEYKERYPIIKGTPLALKTMRVFCETLEVRQIGY